MTVVFDEQRRWGAPRWRRGMEDDEYVDAESTPHVLKVLTDAGWHPYNKDANGGGWFPKWVCALRRAAVGRYQEGPDMLWLKYADEKVRMGYITMMVRRGKRHSKALSAAYRLGGSEGLWRVYEEAVGV